MFRKLIAWIRQVSKKMFGAEKIADVARSGSIVNDEMSRAIDFWIELYKGNAPWLKERCQSMGLPSMIASEIARLVTLEMQVNVTGSKRAEYISKQLDPVRDNIRCYCEYGCAGGGLMLKPYPDGKGNIAIDLVQANAFYPIEFNSRGKITSAVFVERKTEGDRTYSRFETHMMDGELYVVTNKAFESYSKDDLGRECALTDVGDWSSLQPEVKMQNIKTPLFAYFRIPLGNTVDPASPLGVSVYARATSLIRDADEQYQRLIWEFEGGELAIDASEDVFKLDRGVPVLPVGKERLFRTNALDALKLNADSLMKAWSPQIRDASIINGLNQILVRIEDVCGLARGTLSNQVVEGRTATEIIQIKQRSYSTVTDIQKALQSALEDLVYAIDVYASLYKLAPAGKITTSYAWDDSIVVDAVSEREIDRQDCRDGVMQWWEYRVKWYSEDETTAKNKTGFKEDKTDDEVFGFDKPGNDESQKAEE